MSVITVKLKRCIVCSWNVEWDQQRWKQNLKLESENQLTCSLINQFLTHATKNICNDKSSPRVQAVTQLETTEFITACTFLKLKLERQWRLMSTMWFSNNVCTVRRASTLKWQTKAKKPQISHLWDASHYLLSTALELDTRIFFSEEDIRFSQSSNVPMIL